MWYVRLSLNISSNMNTIVAGLLLIFVAATTAANLPETFISCKKSDPKWIECLGDASIDAVRKLGKGLKAYKILPLDPLKISGISIGEAGGSVSVKQEYKNVEVHGLTKNLEKRNFNFDWDKLILSIEAYNPQVDFVGKYKVEGKVLLLPIRGSGDSNITMLNLITRVNLQFEKYTKNGEEYAKIKTFKVKFIPEKVHLIFKNLFDGDPVLAPPMEKFLDENSDILFKELQSSYETSFGLVFKQIGNELFSRVTLKEIFPE
ncbi:protein takeout-like [Leptopilina heterotoma]|uniref:protein takeout-like n=1 Tax=Leptopilina heterotoma TaxID=63436 RepID=UPI001CA949FB|nr:protein takeout-like [Leptopilina heterotoma]